jgi:hypothetical protein
VKKAATFTALLLGSLPIHAWADTNPSTSPGVVSTMRPTIWVLSANWADHLPPTGSVNLPERVTSVCPGQKIVLAIVAQENDRRNLFTGPTLNARLESNGAAIDSLGLRPLAIRQIKAEGADMMVISLEAAGISENNISKLEVATAQKTLAAFQLDWTAPEVDHATDVQISVTMAGEKAAGPVLAPIQIKIRPWADWAREPATGRAALDARMTRYHDNLQPGLLLPLLEAAAHQGGLRSPAADEFFALAFKENPAARNAAWGMLPSLDSQSQRALLFVLRLGGEDISAALPLLPSEDQASLARIEPLQDARAFPSLQDPVSVESVHNIGSSMDRCWGAWMATGDPGYLRALVNLLGGAPDYPEFLSWQKVKGGAKGLNARVANGLAYQIAGWSLRSFKHTDPHVSDWLTFWENDPTVPLNIRKQISSLSTNPAFRRP